MTQTFSAISATEQIQQPDRVLLQRACACGRDEPTASGECARCREQHGLLQRAAVHNRHDRVVPPSVHAELALSGHPLESADRAWFNARFGYDFSDVRVHTGAHAAESARQLDADAYTVGHHIVFGEGRYLPSIESGRRTLAHELAHVLQQRGGPVGAAKSLRVGACSDPLEAHADEAADAVLGGRTVVLPTLAAAGTVLQRQVPFEPLLEQIGPRIGPVEQIGPRIGPVEQIGPQVGEEVAPRPNLGPRPAPGRFPVPPVIPRPVERPEEEEEEEERRDLCGTPRLPLSVVRPRPGPRGQGQAVLAMPLTRCPGNTVGSPADSRVYPEQFRCIYERGLSQRWIPAHLLHGETPRTGPRNLHGPGDQRWNIIIADNSLNAEMSAWVERWALLRVYDLNWVLWYQVNVDEYFPGADLFAKQITVSYGIYNPQTGTKGPPLDHTPQTFRSKYTAPPTCPPGLPAVAAAAPAPTTATAAAATETPLFVSTISVCRNVLNSREFAVTDGGLRVTLSADWVPTEGAIPRTPPPSIDKYELSLAERDLFFDDPQGSRMLPVGGTYSVSWQYLESDDDYYLTIDVPDHDPAWCLKGDISVSTFSAPRPVVSYEPMIA
jgi:hypothetical protein